jgi:hypothetical protein
MEHNIQDYLLRDDAERKESKRIADAFPIVWPSTPESCTVETSSDREPYDFSRSDQTSIRLRNSYACIKSLKRGIFSKQIIGKYRNGIRKAYGKGKLHTYKRARASPNKFSNSAPVISTVQKRKNQVKDLRGREANSLDLEFPSLSSFTQSDDDFAPAILFEF